MKNGDNLMCEGCGDFVCDNGEEYCGNCVDRKAEETRQDEADEFAMLQDDFNNSRDSMSLAELRRYNDLQLKNILAICDSIIASQKITIRNLRALT